MATGAELIVELLQEHRVEAAFGLPGVHNLALWEALRGSSIRLVGVRHEQAAAYAADGYARATGRVGVALVTTGPGAADTLGAVGEAAASRSPVVVIATDIPTGVRREGVHRGVLHEVPDQAGLFAPVTKETLRAGDVGFAVAKAIARAAAAPSRPVYVEIPTDLLSAQAGGQVFPCHTESRSAAKKELIPAVQALAGAQRPLVWAGGGARDAGDAVAALAETLGAPIFTRYTARGLAGDPPLAVGLPPHLPCAGALWDQADVVVAVGSDLDGMSTQNGRIPGPPRPV